MPFEFNIDILKKIRKYPHLIGHMVGKQDLTKMHSAWIRYCWEGESDSSLQSHRIGYKTTSVTEIGSIWWMLFFPNDRISIMRKPYSEAAATLWAIKSYMNMDVIKALFLYAHGSEPFPIVDRDNFVLYSFKKTITKEGSITAHGIDGGYTGRHYDRIVCDDFVTIKDKISKSERNKTIGYIREIRTNIIEPEGKCAFVGTPWHINDSWSILPEPKKYDVYTTGILTDKQIEYLKNNTTKSQFAANYELKHISDDDTLFKNPVYGSWDWKVTGIVAHIDAKYHGNDTGAITIMGKIPDGRFQAVGFLFYTNIKNEIDNIVELMRKYRVSCVYVEINSDKGYTVDILNSKKVTAISYTENTNKHVKIENYLYGSWDSIVWSSDTDDEYMSQILDYNEGVSPDDAADSAASLLREHFHVKVLDKSYLNMYKL